MNISIIEKEGAKKVLMLLTPVEFKIMGSGMHGSIKDSMEKIEAAGSEVSTEQLAAILGKDKEDVMVHLMHMYAISKVLDSMAAISRELGEISLEETKAYLAELRHSSAADVASFASKAQNALSTDPQIRKLYDDAIRAKALYELEEGKDVESIYKNADEHTKTLVNEVVGEFNRRQNES